MCRHLTFFGYLLPKCLHWWELPSTSKHLSLFLPSPLFLQLYTPLPPTWGIVKPKTISVITTATEFSEIRNSLGAGLLMTCKEMKLWQGQKGWEGWWWRKKEGTVREKREKMFSGMGRCTLACRLYHFVTSECWKVRETCHLRTFFSLTDFCSECQLLQKMLVFITQAGS